MAKAINKFVAYLSVSVCKRVHCFYKIFLSVVTAAVGTVSEGFGNLKKYITHKIYLFKSYCEAQASYIDL